MSHNSQMSHFNFSFNSATPSSVNFEQLFETFVNFYRSKYVDFTPPFLNSGLTVLIKVTDNSNNMLGMVFQPFSALLWIMVLLLYILTSCVFWMVSRINPEERGLTIFDAFWNIASAFVYASRPAPNACSKRLVGTI